MTSLKLILPSFVELFFLIDFLLCVLQEEPSFSSLHRSLMIWTTEQIAMRQSIVLLCYCLPELTIIVILYYITVWQLSGLFPTLWSQVYWLAINNFIFSQNVQLFIPFFITTSQSFSLSLDFLMPWWVELHLTNQNLWVL